jgi:hypothetical protein
MMAIFSTSSYGWSPLWLKTKNPLKNNTLKNKFSFFSIFKDFYYIKNILCSFYFLKFSKVFLFKIFLFLFGYELWLALTLCKFSHKCEKSKFSVTYSLFLRKCFWPNFNFFSHHISTQNLVWKQFLNSF